MSTAYSLPPDLRGLRCPLCGSLLGKSAQANVFSIEIRCRKCKVNIRFESGYPVPPELHTGSSIEESA